MCDHEVVMRLESEVVSRAETGLALLTRRAKSEIKWKERAACDNHQDPNYLRDPRERFSIIERFLVNKPNYERENRVNVPSTLCARSHTWPENRDVFSGGAVDKANNSPWFDAT